MGSRDQFCLDNPTHMKGSALNELCAAKRRAKKIEYEDEDYQMMDDNEEEDKDKEIDK